MFVLYVLLGLKLCAGFEVKSSFSIYSNAEHNEEDSSFSVRTEEDQPQLAATWPYLSNTMGDYLCAWYGIWLIYYNVEDYGHGEYSPRIFGYVCGRLDVGIHIGSARYVGEEGVERLNLYNGMNFTSNATDFQTNQPLISTNFSSLILTGHFPVQLYLQPNYDGISYCIQSGSPYNALEDITLIGIQPGDIKSIRFGCTDDAMVIDKKDANKYSYL